MTGPPLLSFIVLSYNYEGYIKQAISSILSQTVTDFEVVVVDDASTDASRDVVSGFGDRRIRLLANERNLGGAASYNRAISEARGEWLVNVDADDWIAPRKCDAQLLMVARDPSIDIIATHIAVVDANGDPHPRREIMEAEVNCDIDLNAIDSWIGRNPICRSSSMIRRETHRRIGLDDPSMVRAPDYELWTRALRHGHRFAVVPEQLTSYRLHSGGVTYQDPRGTFLEISYAMLRNLAPLIESQALWPSFSRIFTWLDVHEELAALPPRERYRLLGAMLLAVPATDYSEFVGMLQSNNDGDALAAAGRNCLALLRANPLRPVVDRLEHDNQAFMGARDWWHNQADRWEERASQAAQWRLRWVPAAVARKVLSPFFRSS